MVGITEVSPYSLTAVGDRAHAAWRGGALGVYRLWRDSGYALDPLVLGAIASLAGIGTAFWVDGGLLGASTIVLLLLLRETEPRRQRETSAVSPS